MLRVLTSWCLLVIFCTEFCCGAEEKLLRTQQDPKCLQPMEPGPCRMNLERYYYNAKTNSCETFKFGGCRGNDNKFGFLKTCEDACVTKANTPTQPTTTSRSVPPAAVTNSKTSTVQVTQTSTTRPSAITAVKNSNKNVKTFVA